MKVLVLGAGGQGGPCASIMEKDPNVEEVRVYDLDAKVANAVKEKIGSDKIVAGTVDATKTAEIVKIAEGVDVIMDFVMPWMARYVMEAALQVGANYVNSAFDAPFWDELVDGKPLSYSKEFEEKGLTALLGCGQTPGFINVLIRQQTDKMDEVESIKIRVATKDLTQDQYGELTVPWDPGWSPFQALKDYSDSSACFENGKYGFVPPLAGLERYHFDDPIGDALVGHHSHEEAYSLPRTIGKGIQYCDFKFVVPYQAAALVTLGLASQEEIDVKGTKIKPIDVATSVLPKPGNSFLEPESLDFDYMDKYMYESMAAEVIGKKDGKRVGYKVYCPKMYSPAQEIYDLFGAVLVGVALPAVTGAKQIAQGDSKKGIIFAEELDPAKFIELFKATGYPYEWNVTEMELL